MKDSKDFFVANIVTNEEMQCNGYMDFLLHHMKEQISNGILDIVSDGNEYAIKMLPEQRIDRPDMLRVEIRQGISVKELVRCKDCKRWFAIKADDDGNVIEYYCVNGIHSPDWFCADGKRKEDN